ncbi:MAG: AbrB/MazE/SpoVT family DNA-binding domain-containing protein [Caldimonas sp.]|nr:AbrB/MazE/SpoVT family DNA-binding domain-containing protein [Pseudomonadota bacterium]
MLATLTSKGQLTVPKAAREALDLKSGQRFAVEVSKSGHLILKPQRADALAVRGLLKSLLARPLSVRETDAAIVAHLRAKHRRPGQ